MLSSFKTTFLPVALIATAPLMAQAEETAEVTETADLQNDTKFYKVAPWLHDLIEESCQNSEDEQQMLKAFFHAWGVNFPPGSKIVYVRNARRLVVVNTAEEHERVKAILFEPAPDEFEPDEVPQGLPDFRRL